MFAKMIACGSIMFCSVASAIGAPTLQVGKGIADITPPPGMPIGGNYVPQAGVGIHDPLYCKALYLQQGETKAVLVSCDLNFIPADVIAKVAAIVEAKSSLHREQLLISATHTHAGPEMHFLILEALHEPMKGLAGRYQADLPAKIAKSILDASASTVAARASVALEKETSVSFNRRYLMADGSVQFLPKKMDPQIVKPVGPIDPDLFLVYFETLDGRALASVVNFTLHVAVAGPPDVSADFPAVIARRLAEVKGAEMMTMFMIGTAGNINHVNAHSSDSQKGDTEVERIGNILGGDVVKAFGHLSPVDAAPMKLAHTVVALATPTFTPAEIEQAKRVVDESSKPSSKLDFLDIVEAFKITTDDRLYHGGPIEADIAV